MSPGSLLNVFSGASQVSKKLYVGNLSYSIDREQLEEMFAAHGPVASVQLIIDRETQRSKGFGFIEMDSEQSAQEAIAALNGKSIGGRNLTVNEARPRETRPGDRKSVV